MIERLDTTAIVCVVLGVSMVAGMTGCFEREEGQESPDANAQIERIILRPYRYARGPDTQSELNSLLNDLSSEYPYTKQQALDKLQVYGGFVPNEVLLRMAALGDGFYGNLAFGAMSSAKPGSTTSALGWLAASDKETVRYFAISHLAALDMENARALLNLIVSDEDSETVRAEAVAALLEAGHTDDRVIRAAKSILGSEDRSAALSVAQSVSSAEVLPEVRNMAARVLRRAMSTLGPTDPGAVQTLHAAATMKLEGLDPLLRSLLKEAPFDGISVASALGDDRAMEMLRRLVENSEDLSVRIEALAVLARSGDASATEKLFEASDRFPLATRRYAEVLGDRAEPRLLEVIQSQNKYVRFEATLALARLGNESSVVAAVNMLWNNTTLNAAYRARLVYALKHVDLPALKRARNIVANDRYWVVRQAALGRWRREFESY